MRNQTENEYRDVIGRCRDIFLKKTRDYGTAWRILRPSSITDQIFIKARRIRSVQEKETRKIDEEVSNEFIGIINYCVMALIQLELPENEAVELSYDRALELFDHYTEKVLGLLKNKNHDYDEAWRDMRVSSITDIILMKLYRIKQIENNKGNTEASEGVEGGYQDIVNYAVFALIKLNFLSNETHN